VKHLALPLVLVVNGIARIWRKRRCLQTSKTGFDFYRLRS